MGNAQNIATEVTPDKTVGWQIENTVQATKVSSYDRQPCLVQDKTGRFILAYSVYSGGTYNIYCTTSSDGATWSQPVAVTSGTGSNGYLSPSLIQDKNGTYWLAYYKEFSGIYVTTSKDAVTWQTPKPFGYNGLYSTCNSPCLMQDCYGAVWLAFQSSINRADIMVSRTFDGNVWSTPAIVTPMLYPEFRPSMIQDFQGTYWIVWYRTTASGGSEIWMSNSVNGEKWSTPNQVSTEMYAFNPTFNQKQPNSHVNMDRQCSVSSGKVWITSSNDCQNWETPQKIIVGTDYNSLFQGQNKLYIAFNFDSVGNDDVWVMTLTPGQASPCWPVTPQGTFTTRYASITSISGRNNTAFLGRQKS